MLKEIPILVDSLANKVKKKTTGFIRTKVGKLFMLLPLVGPIIFFPVQWKAWTTENIVEFQDYTWPLMILVNFSVFVSLCYNGDWRTRLSMLLWIQTMISITLAGIIR